MPGKRHLEFWLVLFFLWLQFWCFSFKYSHGSFFNRLLQSMREGKQCEPIV